MPLDRNKNAPKNSIISPEEIVLRQQYSFNINPSEQHFNIKSPQLRWAKMFQDIEILINTMFAEIHGNLEVSRTGRIHMHGYIRFVSVSNFYIATLPQMLSRATLEIDSIKDFDVWDKYVMKSKYVLNGYNTEIDNHRKLKDIKCPDAPLLEHGGIIDMLKKNESKSKVKSGIYITTIPPSEESSPESPDEL